MNILRSAAGNYKQTVGPRMEDFMRRIRTTLAILVFTTLLAAAGPAYTQIRIGVLTGQDIHLALQPWRATEEYLTRGLGEAVSLVPLNPAAIEPTIRTGHVAFILVDTPHYTALAAEYGLIPIARPVFDGATPDPESTEGSVIIVRRDSSIKSVGEIRGQHFMCVKFSSYSGALAAWRFLKSRDIDPQTECASFREGGTHEAVVEAIRDGRADVGVVRGGVMKQMQWDGRIDLDMFRILFSTADVFSPTRTANPPEWILSAAASTSPRLIKRLRSRLLDYHNDSDSSVSTWINVNPPSKVLPSP